MAQLKIYRGKRKPPGYVKRTVEQREKDMVLCSGLYLKGYSYREITNCLNEDLKARGMGYTVSLSMVYYDLQHLLIEWKREQLENIDEYILQELKKLDQIEKELWKAWEKSVGGKTRVKTSPKKGDRSKRKEEVDSEVTLETSAGNPRYLQLILEVQQRRAKMLGFDKPLKVEIPNMNVTVNDGKPLYDVSVIPKELLYSVVDKLQESEYQKRLAEKNGE